MLASDYHIWELGVLLLYFGILLALSFYGCHRYLMVFLYRRYAAAGDPSPARPFEDDELPVVTVQLPLFNERYVCERLIRKICDMDWPTDRLEIQVLDDSTDDTTDIAEKVVAEYQSRGVDIQLIRRSDRRGYKAGALQNGLKVARGEFVAVFDADFLPEPDFLQRTMHHFTDENLGMVQARWDHINRDYSLLTRAQAIFLDGHFVIEHFARNRSGRFFNFNGTAGIWRRTTIEDAGGWEHDTLTEDLDLSYRAQLKGWRFLFLRDVAVPSELPVELSAFKTQQHRWAKGSLQTAGKLLPTILRSDQPRKIKWEAFQHLTANLAYLLLVLLAILMPLATFIRVKQGWWVALMVDFPIFMAATFSICVFYFLSQRELGRSLSDTARMIPVVLAVGIGISLNNSKAVLEALWGYDTPFVRTPKYAIERSKESWTGKLYRARPNLLPVLELFLGAWFSVAVLVVVFHASASLYSLPFLLLFQAGFLYVALLGIGQALRPRTSEA